MMLKTQKVEHSVHDDGLQVFDAYKAKNGGVFLVLMDLHMPNCDGYEVKIIQINIQNHKLNYLLFNNGKIVFLIFYIEFDLFNSYLLFP